METLREISRSLLSISQGDVSVFERATSAFAHAWSPVLPSVPDATTGTEPRSPHIVQPK
jgi:hypothetical protein